MYHVNFSKSTKLKNPLQTHKTIPPGIHFFVKIDKFRIPCFSDFQPDSLEQNFTCTVFNIKFDMVNQAVWFV